MTQLADCLGLKFKLACQRTAKYNKARVEFTREKLQQTRKQWYEKTASLNLGKDSSKLWNLTKVLNREAPLRSKTVFRVQNKLHTDKKAANEFAHLYTGTGGKAPCPLHQRKRET